MSNESIIVNRNTSETTDDAPPTFCMLCNSDKNIISAKFVQSYSQFDYPSITNRWWECKICNGLFAYPVPSVENIRRHWVTTGYNVASGADLIYRSREGKIVTRILKLLRNRIRPGKLLDFGTNYGYFLNDAKANGWIPSGFEPYEEAANVARDRGFDVRSGWQFEDAGFDEESFDALTCLDVFYYTWHPYKALCWFHKVLKPEGVLLMRISNKRTIFSFVECLTFRKNKLDQRMSRLLQSQFHSISAAKLAEILKSIGFVRIELIPNAFSTSWRQLTLIGKFSYIFSYLIYLITFKTMNLSPGVFLIAQKK